MMDVLSSLVPPASEPVLPLLLELFPSLGNGTSTTAFANIFSFFSESVLICGSIVMSYNVLAGTIQSAHEGQVLGRNYSSLWAPIRMVIAAAALIPSPTTGLSAAHTAVGYAAYWGLGLGNALWSQTITALTGTNPIPLTYPPVPDASPMIGRFIDTELCKEYLNARAQSDQAVQAAGPGAVNTPPYPSPAVVIKTTGPEANPSVVAVAGGAIDLGQTAWHMSFDIVPGVLPQQPNGVIGGCGSFDMTLSSGAAGGPVFSAQVSALKNLEQFIANTVHNAIVTNWQNVALTSNPQVITQLQAIANTAIPYYTRVVSQSSSQVISSYNVQNDAFYKIASSGGWSTAGAWYIALSHVNGELVSASVNEPTITPPRYDLLGGADYLALQSVNAQVHQIFRDSLLSDPNSSTAQLAAATGTNDGAPTSWTTDPGGMIGNLLAKAGLSADNLFDPTKGSTRNDAIAGVVNLGHRLVVIGDMIMVGGGVLSSVPNLVPSGLGQAAALLGPGGWFTSAAVGIAAKLGSLAFAFGGTIWVAGILIGYLLPVLPAMIYLSGVLGWLMLVVEGLVAAPLWALAHLRADGDGFAGPGGAKGYEVAINIFLAPSLMVLGMIVSIAVCNTMLMLLNGTIRVAMNVALAGHLAGITSFIVTVVLFASANVYFAKKSFDLIHLIPANVPVWLGIAAVGRVDASQEGRQLITYGTMAGVQQVGGALNQAAAQLDVAPKPNRPVQPAQSPPLGTNRPTAPDRDRRAE